MHARDHFGLEGLVGLEGLADLGARNGVDMRPTLLRVLTDLYVHRLSHTAAEERHYTELALRLLDAVDVQTRVAVARRFARYLSPPLRVLQRLARDMPEVAAELHQHPLLQPPAPARKAPAIPAAAPDTAENQTGGQKEQNTHAAASCAVDAATADELNDLFFAANSEERRLILLNIEIVAPLSSEQVRIARDAAIARRLEAAALAGNRDEFARQLARALQIPREQAWRIVRDDLGEAVAIVAKVLAMPRDVLYRILIFLNPAIGHSVERVHALAALYDELTVSAAESLLAIWQALRPAERVAAKHRPLLWDDEQRRRARPSVSERRVLGAPQTSERRSAS